MTSRRRLTNSPLCAKSATLFWRWVCSRGHLALIGVLLVAAASCTSAAPTVTVDGSGLMPRLDPTQAVAIARDAVAADEDFLGRVTPFSVRSIVLTTADRVAAHESAASIDLDPSSIVWIVRADGTFVGRHAPSASSIQSSTSGFVVISDISGDVVAYGFP